MCPESHRSTQKARPFANEPHKGGRSYRNTDLFFDSLRAVLAGEDEMIVSHDPSDPVPLGLVVNPKPYKGSHFATFPPKLVEPLIFSTTRIGDTVLDPFSGSGTTGFVSLRAGRNYIGCDLNADYLDLAVNRIQDVSVPADIEGSIVEPDAVLDLFT